MTYRRLFTQSFDARGAIVRALLALVLGALALAIPPAPRAHAATITVNTLTDENDHSCSDGDCSLRDAIEVAAAGDTINFSVTGMIGLLRGDLSLNKNLTISGPGASSLGLSGLDSSRVFYIYTGVNVTISDLKIFRGYETLLGGGIYNSGTLTVTNCTISYNTTDGFGGGIYNGGTLNVTNSTISNNTADNDDDNAAGGGIYNGSGTVNVTGSTVSENNADKEGAGVHNAGGTVDVTGSTVAQNFAGTEGGGIYNAGGAVNVTGSTVSENIASNQGAGIYNNYSGTLNVTDSTFSGNRANSGGGIRNSGTLTVTNSTFTNNDAVTDGGGIYNFGSGNTLNVTNSTFSGNRANSGGGVYRFSGTATLKNTIVANSTAGGNCNGTITDGGGNLVWGDTTCPGINADPKLSALADNGGSTQTMKLGSDSAAIDMAVAANCPSADQRGENRDDLNCDIGAFELKISDSNWVKRTVSNSVLSTFGPARAGIQYSGTNPGQTTIAKVTNWTSQPANAIGAWWDVAPTTGSGLNLTFALCYSTTELRGLTEGDLRFWRYSGGSWSQVGGAPTFSGTSPNRCAQITGVTDLSRWTLATGNPGGAPTAVALQSFDARGVDGAGYAGWLLLALLVLSGGALLLGRR